MLPVAAESLLDDASADERIMARQRKCPARKRLRIQRRLEKLEKKRVSCGRHPGVPRDHLAVHIKLVDEWFGKAPSYDEQGNVLDPGKPAKQYDATFRLRYRMGRHLVMKIYEDITDPVRGSPYFCTGKDRAGRIGPTALMKLAAAMRQIRYGVATHLCDEMTGCPKDVAGKLLQKFWVWVEKRYEGEFLGLWRDDLFLCEVEINRKSGSPGMLGSIDCTHCYKRNCLRGWQGMFQGRNKKRSVIMEAVGEIACGSRGVQISNEI